MTTNCAALEAASATPPASTTSAAVIADAVTLLSSNWNDIRSFTSPRTRRTPGCDRRGIGWASSPVRASASRRPTRRHRPEGLRDRRRRAQLPAFIENWDADLCISRVHHQPLQQPAGDRRLQVLQHRLRPPHRGYPSTGVPDAEPAAAAHADVPRREHADLPPGAAADAVARTSAARPPAHRLGGRLPRGRPMAFPFFVSGRSIACSRLSSWTRGGR